MQDLPDELLLHIFKPFADIQVHDDPCGRPNTPSEEVKANFKTLASLSKVCVKWHGLVEPILYSTFREPAVGHDLVSLSEQIDHFRGIPVSLGVPGQNVDYFPPPLLRDQNDTLRGAPPNQTLRLFLRTIIEQPHLAGYIKKLVLGSRPDVISFRDGSAHRAIKAEPSLRKTYREALARLATLRRTYGSVESSVWRAFVRYVLDGYEGSELLLLLCITPSLTTLHLAQAPVIEEWMVLGNHGLASHVSTIHLGSVDRMEVIQLIRLRAIMMLPHLRHLTFVNCVVGGCPQLPLPRLTHLSIQRCRISRSAFGFLMEHISNLESFEWIEIPYQQYCQERSSVEHHELLAQRMLAFVNRQKSTLRSLRIVGDGLGLGHSGEASFRHHDLLERLTIQGNLVHGENICLSDRLPRSLRYLKVNHCCFHMMHKLVVLVSARALTELEEIKYTYAPWDPMPSWEQYDSVVAELEKQCVAQGIAFMESGDWRTFMRTAGS